MKKILLIMLILPLMAACAAPGETAKPAPVASAVQLSLTPQAGGCEPTAPDMLGPFYVAGAPQRDSVGEGYVLEGAVLAAEICAPVPQAQVEFWLAGPDGEYGDDYRATLNADETGRYRFESHFPPPYAGRPAHVHLRVSAPGYQTLVTQHYPQEGSTGALFDLVLLNE